MNFMGLLLRGDALRLGLWPPRVFWFLRALGLGAYSDSHILLVRDGLLSHEGLFSRPTHYLGGPLCNTSLMAFGWSIVLDEALGCSFLWLDSFIRLGSRSHGSRVIKTYVTQTTDHLLSFVGPQP